MKIGVQELLLAIAIIWSLIWKGIALWNAARNKQLGWYLIILVINALGLLEIIYLLKFQKDKNQDMS